MQQKRGSCSLNKVKYTQDSGLAPSLIKHPDGVFAKNPL